MPAGRPAGRPPSSPPRIRFVSLPPLPSAFLHRNFARRASGGCSKNIHFLSLLGLLAKIKGIFRERLWSGWMVGLTRWLS
jgi:hypothetical protein